jgi:hypothetical protein
MALVAEGATGGNSKGQVVVQEGATHLLHLQVLVRVGTR